MALLPKGFFPDTYFPENYWDTKYWVVYGIGIPITPAIFYEDIEFDSLITKAVSFDSDITKTISFNSPLED